MIRGALRFRDIARRIGAASATIVAVISRVGAEANDQTFDFVP